MAHVRGSDDGDHVEVLFLESASIYVLERERPDFDALLARLREGHRVRIDVAPSRVDVIDDVQLCTPRSGDSEN